MELLLLRSDIAQGAPWRHLLTTRTTLGQRPDALPSRDTTGTTTWIAQMPEGTIAALTWEWVVIAQSVIAIADIRLINSNVYPTDEAGRSLSPHIRTAVLAAIVQRLDWQQVVQTYLDEHCQPVGFQQPGG